MMTLRFHWLHAPRWLAHSHVNRAMTLVLGVIGVSLVFSALRVLDVALSGALISTRSQAMAMAPTASGASLVPDQLLVTDPTRASAPVDASLVEVPAAAVEAIRL
jgi:hypothetical protein